MLILLLLHVFTLVAGHPFYQQRIPNGEVVPHPCKPNNIWRGVGHLNLLGGGPRNAFGLAFEQNGKVWDANICRLDSDGDGKTNGEELGDPDCTWTPGTAPKYSVGLSHPGICEPIDSENCKNTTGFVECDAPEFECPALEDPEAMTFNYTVTIPMTSVPARETTYTCMNFALPADKEYHLVATTPVIYEANVVHHITVFACSNVNDGSELNNQLNQPYDCKMAPDRKCSDMIGAWSVGSAGSCFHENAGFLIGSSGYKFAAFQIHWNNPELRDDYTDASGMVFYLTPKLRPYNAGFIMVGQHYISIPPGQEAYDVSGSCMPECTSRMTSSVFVTAALNHMHYLGKSQISEVRRNGNFVEYLAEDKTYNYDAPVFHTHQTEIEIKPGDEIKTTCTYKSTSRTTVTSGGDATSDEMCFVFLIYYPKEKLPATRCVQSRNRSTCGTWTDSDDHMVQGCDTSIFFNPSHIGMVTLFKELSLRCSISHCKPDCLKYVKQVRKSPCFHGDVTVKHIEYIEKELQGEEKTNSLMFYAMVNSCDVEIAKEACAKEPTNAGSWFKASTSFYILMGFVLFYI